MKVCPCGKQLAATRGELAIIANKYLETALAVGRQLDDKATSSALAIATEGLRELADQFEHEKRCPNARTNVTQTVAGGDRAGLGAMFTTSAQAEQEREARRRRDEGFERSIRHLPHEEQRKRRRLRARHGD